MKLFSKTIRKTSKELYIKRLLSINMESKSVASKWRAEAKQINSNTVEVCAYHKTKKIVQNRGSDPEYRKRLKISLKEGKEGVIVAVPNYKYALSDFIEVKILPTLCVIIAIICGIITILMNNGTIQDTSKYAFAPALLFACSVSAVILLVWKSGSNALEKERLKVILGAVKRHAGTDFTAEDK